MSIWLIIWLIVSAVLVYFAAWTLAIIYRQKSAWKSFAKKNKLRYESPTLFDSPVINGIYKDFPVSLFPCEHQTPDNRGTRKLTAIEVELEGRMPVAGAVGSGGMVSIIKGLDLSDEYLPDEKYWDPSFIIRTEDKTLLAGYLTEERLKALQSLGKIKNVWMIFAFAGNNVILRIDTPDPLDSEKKLRKYLHKMVETAHKLELREGESSRLAGQAAKKAKDVVLNVDEKKLGTGLSLELEEDQEQEDLSGSKTEHDKNPEKDD